MIAAAALAIALPAVPGSVGPFEAAIIVGLQLSGMIDPANGLPQERAFAFAVVLHLVNAACYVILATSACCKSASRWARSSARRGPP